MSRKNQLEAAMNDMLNLLQEHLAQYREERESVINKLKPLENQKKKLDEKIEAYEQLISLEGGIKPDENIREQDEIEVGSGMVIGPLSGKSGQEAYKELINSDLKDKTFKEKEIREMANERGLRINKKFISGSYSRGLLNRMVDQGDLKRLGKGVFDVQTLGVDNSTH